MPARLFTLFCTLLFSMSQAHGATGIVVRLITGGESVSTPVEATLTNDAGEKHTATLVDNGEPPDVNPGDHHYSGSTMLDGENFEVSISLGGDVEEVGKVSWPADVTARDLVITRYEGIVTLETGSGSNTQPDGQPVSGGDTPGGGAAAPGAAADGPPGASPDGGQAGVPGTARAPSVSFASSDSSSKPADDATLYVIGGILLLVLAVVAYFWFKPQEAGGQITRFAGSAAAHRLPEPGMLGEGSPSLSDGASVWIVDEADTTDFLGLLLSSMAQHHRVLVVAPGSDGLPLAAGGPVYRMKNPRPSHVAETVGALAADSGNSMAILINACGVDASTINDYCELLPAEVGTFILVNGSYTGPEQLVNVSREADGWSLTTTKGTVRLTVNPWGLSSALSETQTA